MLHIGHAGRAARLLPRRLAPARPGGLRDDPRPLVRRRPGPAAGVAARGRDGPGRDRRVPPERRHRGPVREQTGLVAVMLVVGAAILWLAERVGLALEGRRATSPFR